MLVTIQDKKLKRIIEKKIKIRKTRLSTAELLAIDELEISDIEIETLDGIQYLNNLTKLIIENCKIHDMSALVVLKEQLTYLSISDSIILTFHSFLS